MDEGSGGPENDFTNRNITFMTYNLLQPASMLRRAAGFPAYGNQRSAWDAGCHPDNANPEHPGGLRERDDVQQEIARGVEVANARLSRIEQVKRYAVLDVDWLPDGDELTPTMKLERKPSHAEYAAQIEELYDEERSPGA